jgi:transposase
MNRLAICGGRLMKRFVEGADRSQSSLLPECLDDFIDESNAVRAIDAFVDALNLGKLGFDGVDPAATGRPAYHPSALLKLYIYGYLNRIQSSRRLEREAGRNLEVIWLVKRLTPDDKTIADFRKDNGPAIKKVCAQFVALLRHGAADESQRCDRRLEVQSRQHTRQELHAGQSRVEAGATGGERRALSRAADLQDPSEALAAKTAHLKEKLAKLASEMQRLETYEKQMLASPDQQISLTDPDSRSMATSGRGSGVVGYNVQVAVDTEHHLIIAHEVTNSGSDRAQLANMATQAKEVLGVHKLEAVADRGYYSGEEIKACADAGVEVTLPKPVTSGMEAKGQFGKHDFVYLPAEDVYRCPAGEWLSYHFTTVDGDRTIRRYWTTACERCHLKARCTKAKNRVISRWEHEHVMEAAQKRLDVNPQAMRVRRETVEHPFGTLKMRMGATHFLMKRLPKVATEMALSVLAYNLTRVLNIIGAKPLIAAMGA